MFGAKRSLHDRIIGRSFISHAQLSLFPESCYGVVRVDSGSFLVVSRREEGEREIGSTRRISIRRSAARINGAVESRANAITIAVRCQREKVGYVICGRAKENLVVVRCREGRCASVHSVQSDRYLRTRYVRVWLCEAARVHRRFLRRNKPVPRPPGRYTSAGDFGKAPSLSLDSRRINRTRRPRGRSSRRLVIKRPSVQLDGTFEFPRRIGLFDN